MNYHLIMPKYSSRVDPIEQLRNVYNKKLEKRSSIKNKGSDLFFDKDIRLNMKTETAWLSTQTQKQYNLGSLWLFLELHSKNIPSRAEYFQKVTEFKMDAVNIADQNQIIQYFTGEIDETPCISQELKMSISQKTGKKEPAAGLQNVEDQPTKKVKLQLGPELQIMEYLFNFQKPVNSKSKCLRFPNKSFEGILKNLIESQQQPVEKANEQGVGKTRVASFYEKKRLPIIIVPESSQVGNVSINNIQKFLTKGEYDETARLENSEVTKIEIEKTLRGKHLAFDITCRPNLLSVKDWEFVVAVFVQGREGEFEGWPFTQPKKIFEKCGFLVRYSKSLASAARQWRVKHIILQKNVKYAETAVNTIWADIEKYIFQKI